MVAAEAKASIDVATAWAECKAAAEAEMAAVRAEPDEVVAAARAEAEKAVEDEFRASFLQGYSDLQRRVALNHS